MRKTRVETTTLVLVTLVTLVTVVTVVTVLPFRGCFTVWRPHVRSRIGGTCNS